MNEKPILEVTDDCPLGFWGYRLNKFLRGRALLEEDTPYQSADQTHSTAYAACCCCCGTAGALGNLLVFRRGGRAFVMVMAFVENFITRKRKKSGVKSGSQKPRLA